MRARVRVVRFVLAASVLAYSTTQYRVKWSKPIHATARGGVVIFPGVAILCN